MIQLEGDFYCLMDTQGLPPAIVGAPQCTLLQDANGGGVGRIYGLGADCHEALRIHASFGDCELNWDGYERRLVLKRNHIGRQTIYVRINGSRLLLSSRLPSMSAWGGIESQLDEVAIADLWRFGRILPPRTLFQDIRHLQPGSVLRLNAQANRWETLETLLPWTEDQTTHADGMFDPGTQASLAGIAEQAIPNQHSSGTLLAKELSRAFDEIAHLTQALGQPVAETGLVLQSLLLRRRRSKAPIFLDVGWGLSPNSIASRRRWMQQMIRTPERRRCDNIWNGERRAELERVTAAAGVLGMDPAHDSAIDCMAAKLILIERRLDLSTLARAAGQSVRFVESVGEDAFATRALFPDEADELNNLACQVIALVHRRNTVEVKSLIGRLQLDAFRINSLRRNALGADRLALDQSFIGILTLCHLARFHRALPQPAFPGSTPIN